MRIFDDAREALDWAGVELRPGVRQGVATADGRRTRVRLLDLALALPCIGILVQLNTQASKSRSWVEVSAAVSAIVISAASLFIAVRQNGLMEKQLSASI